MIMDKKAVRIVGNFVSENTNRLGFSVYIVWKCKILHHWKYLISTDLEDGMYYELTFNGCKNEWYLDAYKKNKNVVITNDVIERLMEE